ncbi:hypothetical protein TREES_T100003415 [Tupaia chinensis]|uniref:Alpha-1,3-mannosyl-glycoprotein 4-beta-N-acetylglucosaminyltransferase C n=2 Tax=Tupaia chinensis TaxID=246437 RepID=L9JFC2_TUPCH|nr:hypothetical protein TREES_T100003415 [Tupaia chinensis]
MVLVHLVHTDFTWIGETTARISSLFSLQILAGQLLLIRTPPDAYPSMDGLEEEACREECYLKQNIDYAFLMSFAAKFSDYFLLMEDDIFCVPNFVTHIYSKVTDLKPNPWVLLEFSDTGVGRLFHSSDLPLLAHFLLLFYKERPSDKLMEHFRTLLLQEEQIFCTPFLFYQSLMDDEKEEATQIQKKLYGPDNPPGAIVTTMQVFSAHFPWEAYTLDESFFWTYNVSAGQHLTVILNHPANLKRVQVMTGSIMDGTYALEKGHVELGYDPQGMPQHCSSFALLGQLQDGQLDQEILVKNMSSHVSCVKLVVKASQADGLMIRHIYLWEENAKEEKVDQS